MADIRTTIAIREATYASMKSQYRALGFTRLGDLVNEAIESYLKKSLILAKDRQMEEAAADPSYRKLLKQISMQCATLDAEGLPEY